MRIWKGFAEKHADFPVRATFFVLPPVPWGQKGQLPAKLKMLKDWKCELGSHTVTHSQLSKLTEPQVKTELADSVEFIKKLGFEPESIALPFGISPKNPKLLQGFDFRGKHYGFKSALLVGAGPAPSPTSPRANFYRLPRIQGIEGDYGITFWLNKVKAGQVKPYVQP